MTTEIILQTVMSGLLMGFIYALVAAGLSLIFGLMEIVNFAHGEFMMLAMFAAFWLYTLFGFDPLLSIPFAVALLFAVASSGVSGVAGNGSPPPSTSSTSHTTQLRGNLGKSRSGYGQLGLLLSARKCLSAATISTSSL